MEGFAVWTCNGGNIFTSLAKPILFICQHKAYHIIVCFDDILVLIQPELAGKKAYTGGTCLTHTLKICENMSGLNNIWLIWPNASCQTEVGGHIAYDVIGKTPW